MATASAIDAQVGYAVESTPGTYAAPTKTIEHVSFSLTHHKPDIASKGMKAGRRGGNGRRSKGIEWVDGSISHELGVAAVAPIFRNLMGAVSTSGTNPYTHVFTYGALSEGALTIQAGKPDLGGTVRAFSYLGCQITKATISSKIGENSMLSFEVYGQTLDTGQSLAAASYPSAWSPLNFSHCVLSVAGAEYEFDDLTLNFDSGLKTGRHTHRSTNPSRPRISKEAAYRTAGGTINSEFIDLTAYARYAAGSEVALSAVWNAGASAQLTVAGNVRFLEPSGPDIDGPDMLKVGLPFEFVSTTSDAAMLTVTLINADSSATAF